MIIRRAKARYAEGGYVMLRAILAYLFAVLFFGSFMALSSVGMPEGKKVLSAINGFVFWLLFFGGIFLNGIIRVLTISPRLKVVLTFVTAAGAGLIAYSFYAPMGGEAAENLRAGWGDDTSRYVEYPIKGHEFIGLTVTFLYLVMAFSGWFFAMSDKAIAAKKMRESESAMSSAE